MRTVVRQVICDSGRFGHSEFDVSAASGLREAGIGTGCLVVVEQRLDAVRAVLRGAEVVEVAARVGVHRSTTHRWVVRYLTGLLGGDEPSHPPVSSPRQVADAVEFATGGDASRASPPVAITGQSTRRS
jgi:hypothetical protein